MSDKEKIKSIISSLLKYRRGEYDGKDDLDNAIYCIDEIEMTLSR